MSTIDEPEPQVPVTAQDQEDAARDASRTSDIAGKGGVKVKTPVRSAVYYQVTESEIETYAQLGFLSNICLSLFTLFGGFGLGCYSALAQQDNLPEPNRINLYWLIGFSLITSLMFFGLALALTNVQNNSKKIWRTEIEEK